MKYCVINEVYLSMVMFRTRNPAKNLAESANSIINVAEHKSRKSRPGRFQSINFAAV